MCETNIIAPSGYVVARCATDGDAVIVARCDLDLCGDYKKTAFCGKPSRWLRPICCWQPPAVVPRGGWSRLIAPEEGLSGASSVLCVVGAARGLQRRAIWNLPFGGAISLSLAAISGLNRRTVQWFLLPPSSFRSQREHPRAEEQQRCGLGNG